MPPAVLVGLIVFGVAVAAGLALAIVKGLQMWRAVRALNRRMTPELGELEAGLAGLERRSAALETGSARLTEASARLQGSVAAARVIADTLREAVSVTAAIRGALPRK